VADVHHTLETSEWKGCEQAKAQLHEHRKTIALLVLPQLQREVHMNWNESFNSNTARKTPKWLSLAGAYTPRMAFVLSVGTGATRDPEGVRADWLPEMPAMAMRRLRARLVVLQDRHEKSCTPGVSRAEGGEAAEGGPSGGGGCVRAAWWARDGEAHSDTAREDRSDAGGHR
jgi:hypothetical protein